MGIKGQWKWWIENEIYEKAVENTKGKIILVDGDLKLVPYHEISAGVTRDGQDVFGNSIAEKLCYYQSQVGDYDPNTYFAYLEGLSLPD